MIRATRQMKSYTKDIKIKYILSIWARQSNRFDQAVFFGAQIPSGLTRAFAISISFLTTVTIVSLVGFPAVRWCSYFA
jgi:hypothetical protein